LWIAAGVGELRWSVRRRVRPRRWSWPARFGIWRRARRGNVRFCWGVREGRRPLPVLSKPLPAGSWGEGYALGKCLNGNRAGRAGKRNSVPGIFLLEVDDAQSGEASHKGTGSRGTTYRKKPIRSGTAAEEFRSRPGQECRRNTRRPDTAWGAQIAITSCGRTWPDRRTGSR